MLHVLELNHWKIFPSAFRLDAFHRINPRGAFLAAPDRDAITKTKVPGIAGETGKVGAREGKTEKQDGGGEPEDDRRVLQRGGDRWDKRKTADKIGGELQVTWEAAVSLAGVAPFLSIILRNQRNRVNYRNNKASSTTLISFNSPQQNLLNFPSSISQNYIKMSTRRYELFLNIKSNRVKQEWVLL